MLTSESLRGKERFYSWEKEATSAHFQPPPAPATLCTYVLARKVPFVRPVGDELILLLFICAVTFMVLTARLWNTERSRLFYSSRIW
jgi:hypothetical protein